MFNAGDTVYYGNIPCKVLDTLDTSYLYGTILLTIIPFNATDPKKDIILVNDSMVDTEEEFETIQRVLSQFHFEPIPWPDDGESHKSCKECKEEK